MLQARSVFSSVVLISLGYIESDLLTTVTTYCTLEKKIQWCVSAQNVRLFYDLDNFLVTVSCDHARMKINSISNVDVENYIIYLPIPASCKTPNGEGLIIFDL